MIAIVTVRGIVLATVTINSNSQSHSNSNSNRYSLRPSSNNFARMSREAFGIHLRKAAEGSGICCLVPGFTATHGVSRVGLYLCSCVIRVEGLGFTGYIGFRGWGFRVWEVGVYGFMGFRV